MPIPLDQQPPTPPKRRSIIRRAFHGARWIVAGPVDWTGARRIWRGASFIQASFETARADPRADPRFKSGSGGAFDLRATAFSCGVSPAEMESRLAARRQQTARIAYATFALAWVFLLAWLWQALSSPWSAGRIVSAVCFLPFCALFFLIAFYNALLNFQIRMCRLASWREYLVTTEPFWPN